MNDREARAHLQRVDQIDAEDRRRGIHPSFPEAMKSILRSAKCVKDFGCHSGGDTNHWTVVADGKLFFGIGEKRLGRYRLQTLVDLPCTCQPPCSPSR